MPVVKGEYLGHSAETGQFVYRFTCQDCGREFRESTEEVSFPCICHLCSIGGTEWLQERDNARKRRQKRKAKKSS